MVTVVIDLEDTREFSEAIEGALSKGGKVLIPSFVVDRPSG